MHQGDPDLAWQAVGLGFASGFLIHIKLGNVGLHMQKNMSVILTLLQGQDDLR